MPAPITVTWGLDIAWLIDGDLAFPDHVPELVALASHELRGLGRRFHGVGLETEVDHLLAQIGSRNDFANCSVEPGNRSRRSARRRLDRFPGADVEAWNARLRDGRNIRRAGYPLRGRDGKRPQLAVLREIDRGAD